MTFLPYPRPKRLGLHHHDGEYGMKLNLSQASNFEIVQFLVLLEPTKGALDRSSFVVQQLPLSSRTRNRAISPVFVTDPQVDNLAIIRVSAQTEFALQFLGAPPLGYSLFTIIALELHRHSIVTVRRSDLVASLIPRLGRFLGAKSHQNDGNRIEFFNDMLVNILGIIASISQNILGSEVLEALSCIFQKGDALSPVMSFRSGYLHPDGNVRISIGHQMSLISEPPLFMPISSALGRPRCVRITLALPCTIAVSVHDGAVNCDGTPEARNYFIQVGNQSGHASQDKFSVGQEFLSESAISPRRWNLIWMGDTANVGEQRIVSQCSDKTCVGWNVENETCQDSLDHDRNGIAGPTCSAGSFQILNQTKNLRVVKDHVQAFGEVAVLPSAKPSTIDTLCYDRNSQGFNPLVRGAPLALESKRGFLTTNSGGRSGI